MTSTPSSAPLSRTLAAGLLCIVLLLLAGTAMPKWLTFLITMSAANGLVSLGIVVLMRSGVVSFGQGMVFALGGYAAALAYSKLGITDAFTLAVGGALLATIASLPFAYMIARYRGIFFAMLSLSLSMVSGQLGTQSDRHQLPARRLHRRHGRCTRSDGARSYRTQFQLLDHLG